MGGLDKWTPEEDLEFLRGQPEVEIALYPDADHAFAHDPARPTYRKDDAEDAWARAVAFLASGDVVGRELRGDRPARHGPRAARISLRRRHDDPSLDIDVFEVKLGDEFLMSSLFTASEIALATLALAALPGADLDVVVGGLGLGYTAAAVLADGRVRSPSTWWKRFPQSLTGTNVS